MSSIGQNQYSHAASRFTGPNQMLMSSPGTNETIVLDLNAVPVGHAVGRTASGVGTFVPAGVVTFPLLAPTTTATTPSFSFSATPQDGLYFDGTNIGIGRTGGLSLSTPSFGCFALGTFDCPTPTGAFATGIIATTNAGNATPVPTITAASGNSGCCIVASEHVGTGATNDMSITGARGSAILACRSGSNTLGARLAILNGAIASLIASSESSGQGGSITTSGTASTVVASRGDGAAVTVGGVASIVAATSAGSSSVTTTGTATAVLAVSGSSAAGLARITANAGLLAACTIASTGTMTAGGNSSALIAVRHNGIGTTNTVSADGTQANAVIACLTGANSAGSVTRATGSASLIAACEVSTSGGSLIAGNASCALACTPAITTMSLTGSSGVIMASAGTTTVNSISNSGNSNAIIGVLHAGAGSITTPNTASAIIAVRTVGTNVSNVVSASGAMATAVLACRTGATTTATTTTAAGQGTLIAACNNATNAGSITTAGNGQAVIACDPTGGSITIGAAATSSAVIACGTTITMTATNTFAAAVTNSLCNDANSACIGGTALDSNGVNSLTSSAVFAGTVALTCDATQKVEMENTGIARAAFITKLKATKPKRYRLKAEDKGAKKRRGFDAADLEAFDDVVVKTGRRVVKVRQTEDGKWEDASGNKYNNADPDSDENDDDEDDRPRGKVFRDKQLNHSYLDVTAMLSLVWEGLQHMQSQIDELKAATVSVKVGL